MTMSLSNIKNKKKYGSYLLVCVIVAASFAVILPLTSPSVQAISRLATAGMEDNNPMYDNNMAPNIVEWHTGEDHVIDDMMGSYVIEDWMTVVIPPLNPNTITFVSPGDNMEVWGTLIFQPDGSPFSKANTITGTEIFGWNGTWFKDGSSGTINDIVYDNSVNGIVFEPGSTCNGIIDSNFENYKSRGVRIDGTLGVTNVDTAIFDVQLAPMGTGLDIQNTEVNVVDSTFSQHGLNEPQIYIKNATVSIDNTQFYGGNPATPGNLVFIDEESNGTVLNDCDFDQGVVGDHYIRVDASTPLIDNSSFVTTGGSMGALSVEANENVGGTPAMVRVRNPTADGNPGFWDSTFDNSTMNATGTSSIDLQWYVNVYVRDPDNNPIANSPVIIKDRLLNPSQPPTKQTETSAGGFEGWARWFTVTELTLYELSIDYFNPFNISAENNSVKGYAIPPAEATMSIEVTITVPFSLIANSPPTVSYIETLIGSYSGLISLDFIIEDMDPGDDGNLSVDIFFSRGDGSWRPAAVGAGSQTSNLLNNTLYTFYWDSRLNLTDEFNNTVYLRIVPIDKSGPGPFADTGPFTVDNEPPNILSGPTITPTNVTVLIEWTVHENAEAKVWWGPYANGDIGDLTTETVGNSGTTAQQVTLTGLTPGEKYTFVFNSTDPEGNERSSMPDYQLSPYTFVTSILIDLYTGWNMISLAPLPISTLVDDQLSSITGQFDAVQIYDTSDPADPWKHYVPGKGMGNDLTDIFPDHGVWIKMKNNAVLTVNHFIPDPGTPEEDSMVPIVYGWNFVGYPSITTRTVSAALSSFTWDKVQMYDVLTDTWYHNDGPGGDTDTLTNMETGRGYWVHCPVLFGGTWTLSYR